MPVIDTTTPKLICETIREQDGERCRHKAVWLVRVGTRKTDQQLCCAGHLNYAASAMIGAEGRAGAWLAVSQLNGMSPEALRRLAEVLSDMRYEEYA
jgi:hypothetical protein